MSREVKFKFWCKGTSTNANFNKTGWWSYPDFLLSKYYSGFNIFESDDFISCQYSGLKDRNCKEIYEGDIIEVGFGEHQGALGKMIFEYGSFMLESQHGAIFTDTYKSCLYGKIVGNIFENSELLKQ